MGVREGWDGRFLLPPSCRSFYCGACKLSKSIIAPSSVESVASSLVGWTRAELDEQFVCAEKKADCEGDGEVGLGSGSVFSILSVLTAA